MTPELLIGLAIGASLASIAWVCILNSDRRRLKSELQIQWFRGRVEERQENEREAV